jgi:hypothetical protein
VTSGLGFSFVESFVRWRVKKLIDEGLRIEPDPRGHPNHVAIAFGPRVVNVPRTSLIEHVQSAEALDAAVREVLGLPPGPP